MKNGGGSAFPDAAGREWGMTLRDYFAAHAPSKILWNFKIDASDMGEPPTIKALEGWREKQLFYDMEFNRRKYMAWPYVWADAMLVERNKT